MIRELKKNEIDIAMELWLTSTIIAHPFIPKDYWLSNRVIVKENYLPASKTFVYVDSGEIKGFISIVNDEFVGALFVKVDHQGQGIGKALIEFVKGKYPKLRLAVYTENQKALNFYINMGFVAQKQQLNVETKRSELIMQWES